MVTEILGGNEWLFGETAYEEGTLTEKMFKSPDIFICDKDGLIAPFSIFLSSANVY